MAPKQKDQQVLDELHENVSAIFDQVQGSMANHKKNCVALYKVHVRTAEIVETVAVNNAKKGKGKKEVAQEKVVLVGEREFQEAFMDMISRVLDIKKGTGNVDRVVKYVGVFVKFMNEKLVEVKTKKATSSSVSAKERRNAESEDDEDEENSTTRFVARLLNWLLQGFVAKNKNVRYRCSQLVAEMISHLGEIDEDTYSQLRQSLMQRLNDKESLIRAHAVIAISKLAGSEDEDELADGEQSILQTLLDTLETDPAVEVRRAALINIPIAPSTIDALLSRTRDVDAITRKLVYTAVIGGKIEHPRQLSITQRELIIKDGLGDREPAVRLAAGKLVGQWFDWVLGQEPQDKDKEEEVDGWEGDDGGIMKGLIKFLGLFDVVGPGEAVAVDALLSILTTRREVLDAFLFPEEFWKHLTPESIVLARVFVEHCVSSKNDARLEAAVVPVVTAFAFIVQEAYNNLLSVLEEIETAKILNAGLEDQEDEEQEEELAKREVIMSELLRLALKLDYGDEIGRRRVFMVTKDMLAHPQLPPGLIERCLDVMKEIMPSERDLIRVIVEIVVELRDGEAEELVDEAPIPDDQSDVSTTFRKERVARKAKERQDMTTQERQVADMTDIRCLMLCIAMLERVNGTFEDNSTLEGILSDLIIPSVKRKELAMREKALVSLGLCCLIARNMALSSFQLFLSQAKNAPPELKVQVLKVIMDLLIMYDQEFFGKSEETAKQIVDFLLQLLEAEESTEAQAVLATGLCKLLLAGIVTDSKVLVCLAILYVSPATVDNQEIRQCLAYFFPVYSYSSLANQDRVRSIFMSTFDISQKLYEELDDDHEMISPQQFGLLMVDWSNPEKAAEIAAAGGDHVPPTHANLAVDILVALYDEDRTMDEQKILLQFLGQLHIEHGLDIRLVQKLNILLTHHDEECPFENAVNDKLFEKFKKRIDNLFADDLKESKPEIDEEFRDLYQQIGVEVPEEGEGNGRRISKKARGKRRALSEDDEEDGEDGEDEEQEAEGEDDDNPEEEEHNGNESQVHQADAEATQNDPKDGSDVEEASDKTETETQEKSPSPVAPPRKARARKTTRLTAPKSRNTRRSTRNAPETSDEENVPPQLSAATVTATPTKKKGVKRIHTPGSGNVNSPANRKRTKVKAPRLPIPLDKTPTNSDIESPPTPTKPTRQTRGRKAIATKKAKEPTPPPLVEEESEDEDDAEEVASMIASDRSTPPPPSSDDFGGY